MTLPATTPQSLATLAPVETGRVATRVLHKTGGGSASVLAMAAGEGLREHTNPSEALVVAGEARISVAGEPHTVRAGETIRLPASVPHAVEAVADLRMLLILLHES